MDHDIINPNVPLNEQLYIVLKNEIQDGLWVGRDDFPGELELASRFGISVITTKKILNRLVEAGLIDRGRGRRTKVVYIPTASKQTNANFFSFSEEAFTYKLLSSGVDIGWAEACVAFDLAPGSSLWQLKRLRLFERRPHSVSYNAQLPQVGHRHSIKDLRKLPMIHILRKEGITPGKMYRRFGVANPPIEVAENLGISLSDPVLTYAFTITDKSDVAVEWVRIYLHPGEELPVEILDFKGGSFVSAAP